MADPYYRNCRDCGQKIRMAEMENGQWLAFEIDGSGKHECWSDPVSRAVVNVPNRTANEPVEMVTESASLSRDHEMLKNETRGSRSCLVIILMFILFIVFCIWYFIS